MENMFDRISSCCRELKLNFGPEDVAAWSTRTCIGDEGLSAVLSFLDTVETRMREDAVSFLMRLSRLPKDAGTMEGFKTDRFDKDAESAVRMLRTLSFIETGTNVLLTGATGTGKTHLAQALAMECCKRKMKTYYMTFRELDEMLTKARIRGGTKAVLTSLARYTCLVVDKVADLRMDETNTCLFSELVDKRKQKGHGSMILTSGTTPSYWTEYFTGAKVLETTIDRLMDNVICIAFSGDSYRGMHRQVFQFKTKPTMDLIAGTR